MDKRTIYLFVLVFTLIIVAMFIYAFLMRSELAETTFPDTEIVPDSSFESQYLPDIVEGKVFYSDGEFVFAGVVTTPTPCDLLEVNVVLMESMPEQIRLDFTTLNTAESCIQVLSDQRFLTTPVKASPDAVISATYNGQSVNINFVPALPGESPEEFELFIKG
jgi:hypothetical protein